MGEVVVATFPVRAPAAPCAEPDAQRPARGIVIGLLIVAPFWAAAGAVGWVLWHG